jgi:hypothetical protein
LGKNGLKTILGGVIYEVSVANFEVLIPKKLTKVKI